MTFKNAIFTAKVIIQANRHAIVAASRSVWRLGSGYRTHASRLDAAYAPWDAVQDGGHLPHPRLTHRRCFRGETSKFNIPQLEP